MRFHGSPSFVVPLGYRGEQVQDLLLALGHLHNDVNQNDGLVVYSGNLVLQSVNLVLQSPCHSSKGVAR